MTGTSHPATAWQRRFLTGDPVALEGFAADVDELTVLLAALMTGEGDWEPDAQDLLEEMRRAYVQAEGAFTLGDLDACLQCLMEQYSPASAALTALLRERVLKVEFFHL
jgi:hypothetical protein